MWVSKKIKQLVSWWDWRQRYNHLGKSALKDIQTMPGFKNVLFGGEGLFVTTLTGPGTVWLQGLTPQRMVSDIARRVPGGGGGMILPVGMGGGGEGGEDGGADSSENSS